MGKVKESFDEPLVGNTADEKQIRNGKKKEKLKANEEVADMMDVLRLDAGRRFLFELLDFCCVWHSCFDRDITVMSHNTGKQDVGHWVMARIADANPGVIAGMHEEFMNRENKP